MYSFTCIYLYVRLSIYHSFYLSVYLFVCLSFYLLIYLSIRLYRFLFWMGRTVVFNKGERDISPMVCLGWKAHGNWTTLGLSIIPSIVILVIVNYTLVNVYISMEHHRFCYGKINYFHGHWQHVLYVKLLEGLGFTTWISMSILDSMNSHWPRISNA